MGSDIDTSPYSLARWITAADRVALDRFLSDNRGSIADDVDDDPVYLATSAFMMRRTEEMAQGLTFRDVKDHRAEKLAA